MAKAAVEEKLPRIFLYNGTELEDPDPNMSEKDVKARYESIYPEITTANLSFEIKDVDGVRTEVWTFKKAVGTKG